MWFLAENGQMLCPHHCFLKAKELKMDFDKSQALIVGGISFAFFGAQNNLTIIQFDYSMMLRLFWKKSKEYLHDRRQ